MKKQAWADILAMITYSTVIGLIVEIFIAKLTLGQSLRSRATSIPANFLTARPYGLYRDWVKNQLTSRLSGAAWVIVADIIAFSSFQVPLYIVILMISGATLEQAVRSSVTVLFVSLVSGRPYGILLEFFRRVLADRTAAETQGATQ